jgi:hypothetical protein
MQKTFSILILSLSLAIVAAAQTAAPPNTLSPEEKAAGWTLLFDGSSMSQWRGYQKPDTTGLRWQVKDGCLGLPPADGADTRGSRDLITRDQFGDFELKWQYRISPGGNSGVKYFVTETREAAIGHEFQIIDDEKHPDAKLRNNRRTGSFYDVLAAPAAKPRGPGEWNEGRIVVKGNHVEHWLNGSRILEYTLDSDELRKSIADSKFKDTAGFDKHQRGHILLQDHGDQVCYAGIKIRPLGASGSPATN